MSVPRTKFVLRTSKTRTDGTAPVWLRITANRKARFVSTGVAVNPKYWNERRERVRSSHEIAPALNARLSSVALAAQEAALSATTAKGVLDAVSGSGGASFSGFFRAFIDELQAAGQYWEWKKYRVTLGKLVAVLGEEFAWADVDRAALQRFQRSLEVKGNQPNTIRKELQRVRRVVRLAIRRGTVKPADDPFLTFDLPSPERVERRKLSQDEIAALAAVEPETDAVGLARDCFLFAFYGGGIRFGDVCSLPSDAVKDGRLTYRMNKTGNLVSSKLPPVAIEIAKRYVNHETGFLFPFLTTVVASDPIRMRKRISSRNVVVNRDLKRLAARAGISETGLSFHIARHSFADYARRKSGDLHALRQALGHSSLQVTQAYLASFDQDAVDRLNEALWSSEESE